MERKIIFEINKTMSYVEKTTSDVGNNISDLFPAFVNNWKTNRYNRHTKFDYSIENQGITSHVYDEEKENETIDRIAMTYYPILKNMCDTLLALSEKDNVERDGKITYRRTNEQWRK